MEDRLNARGVEATMRSSADGIGAPELRDAERERGFEIANLSIIPGFSLTTPRSKRERLLSTTSIPAARIIRFVDYRGGSALFMFG